MKQISFPLSPPFSFSFLALSSHPKGVELKFKQKKQRN